MLGLSRSKMSVSLLGFVALSLFGMAGGLSATEVSWLLYKQGQRSFEEKSFAEALNTWQEATELRKDRYEAASEKIARAIEETKSKPVKDSIRKLFDLFAREEANEREIRELRAEAGGSLRKEAELWKLRNPVKGFYDFLDGLLMVLDLRSAESLHDSLAALLATSRLLERFPEAEFGLGRVLLAEGELGLAELQFTRALEYSASLAVPDEKQEILAALTSLYKVQGKWNEYEAGLVRSLEGSETFASRNEVLRNAMRRALTLKGFDEFLRLYRIKEPRIQESCAELGEYLLRHGRPEAVIHLAISANITLSRIIGRIQEGEPSFTYHDLPALLKRIHGKEELRAWAEEKELWRGLYYLGEACLKDSELVAAKEILGNLARWPDAGSWGEAARLALARSPKSGFVLP